MLGKLWKHEAKTQGRVVCGMYGVLAAATILIVVLNAISHYAYGRIFGIVFSFSCVTYAFAVIAAVIVNFVYLCFNFYQSMYSQQGYLTHTLPVKTTQILNVKIAVSFVYLFLTGILCMLSFASIGMAADSMQIGTMIELAGRMIHEGSGRLGVSEAVFVFFMVLIFVLGYLNVLLMFFAGSSIGQLFHRSKGAWGIAAGIALYYCSQIISLILVFLAWFLDEKLIGTLKSAWIMAGASLLILGWTVVYYMISRVIVQKHLNLE